MSLKGVQPAYTKNKKLYYKASITYKNKHISLGSYNTEAEAHQAYLEAYDIVFNNNYTIVDFSENIKIPFEKWVILHNFRDNNYYIRTPIYLYKSYFCYYLDEKTEFKFSTEDLFFYAIHKIHFRNGYYYINDHGQQINILSRYNIKNYAVQGKDYFFKNGDIHDFRILNLVVINRYNGVSQIIKNNKILYVSKIYNKSNLLVGIYNTEIEAAIAYNKAIDLLSHHGIDKQDNKNYIYNLSSNQYKEIYRVTKISNNIINSSSQKRPVRFREYSGVHKQQTGYRAYIGYKYKHVYLGMYSTDVQAAQAYNQAALILYGDKANLNHTLPTVNPKEYKKIIAKIKKVFPNIEERILNNDYS